MPASRSRSSRSMSPVMHPPDPRSATVDTLIYQIDPSSAYADAKRFMLDFSKNALVNGGDPADVANAVVAAVADAGTPLHVHVGADADAFLELWSRTGTFETFI